MIVRDDFRRYDFCLQLLFCFNDWAKSRNKRNPTDVILLDFSKAFDSVPHRPLLHKLV